MAETMLGARNYTNGNLTSETGACGVSPSYKHTPTGIVSAILFKQATGKEDYFPD